VTALAGGLSVAAEDPRLAAISALAAPSVKGLTCDSDHRRGPRIGTLQRVAALTGWRQSCRGRGSFTEPETFVTKPESGAKVGKSQAHKSVRVRRTTDHFTLETSAPDFRGPAICPGSRGDQRAPTQHVAVDPRCAPTCGGVGWRGRIRTFDLLIQSQAPESGLANHRVSVEDSNLYPIPG
jgi:hypothetical protein